jgi:hypothetical protein
MSTSAKPTPPARTPEQAVRVVSHTGLLYWWPVWLTGFVLAGLTYLDGGHLAIVPEGTKVTKVDDRTYTLTVPNRPGPSLEQAAEATGRGEAGFPVRASWNRDYGMVYVVVLLLVIAGSTIPLRGLWSVVAFMSALLLTGVLAYYDVWGVILEALGGLHVEISLAGYLLPSLVLLVLWLATVFGFDQLRYVRFTAGQFTVHQAVGDAREVYNTERVTIRKRRSDMFRHWILGFGAGDLVITVPNQGKEIVLSDVLFADRRVQQIADLMRVRPVVSD